MHKNALPIGAIILGAAGFIYSLLAPKMTSTEQNEVPAVVSEAVVTGELPVLMITSKGHFLTSLDENGSPAFERIKTVIDLSGGQPPTSPPIGPPGPPITDPPADIAPPEGIAAEACDWAKAVNDASGAQRYALIMETVRDGLRDQKLSVAASYRVLSAAADDLMTPGWNGFRAKLSEHLTIRAQSGKIATANALANELELVRYGVGYSAMGKPPIADKDAVAVVAKVLQLIDQEQAQ